ncbi:ESCRT-II subunit protein SNF8 [Sugiyamaella lignohabitans]|uniref:Vacuolar-sorting protein SNF8 n=1 Tax=Sugiyamaella lignohabitans TaxID=796027 RepID=A0A167DTM3_9ASCO|nr:ESCRT-II subunit protein SNF8 [Sugiyamaella lignohabitans]ANB13279.1 ESCRT-II subunit protein SNF8 [Sugiyamaella lignohabitans]
MKRVGLAAFDTKHRAAFDDLSSNILQEQVEQLNTQLSVFQSALAYFAVEHAADIRNNPEFRAEFSRMCTTIGVDPLAGSSSNNQGSLWANMLGKDVNDFYFELAVRVIEICRLTRDTNGGLISVSEMKTRLADKSQLRPIEVTEDDIERSVKSLKSLGRGFELVQLGTHKKMMIRSVPSELSNDQTVVLGACEALGYVTVTMLHDNLGWIHVRSRTVLGDMVAAGLLWADTQGVETEYWAPSWLS